MKSDRQRSDMTTAKGRALAASPRVSSTHLSTSRLPPGTRARVDMTVKSEGPPSREFDLQGHYHYRFDAARGDYWLTERLCAQAERDWRREIKGNRGPMNEDGPAKDRRILQDYQGLPPWEVATWEDCSPESVKRLRRSALLNPEDGLEVEHDERTARIVALTKEGKSQRSIALIVGLSHQRVAQILVGA